MGAGVFEDACKGTDKDYLRLAALPALVNFNALNQRTNDIHGSWAHRVIGEQVVQFRDLAAIEFGSVRVDLDLGLCANLFQLPLQRPLAGSGSLGQHAVAQGIELCIRPSLTRRRMNGANTVSRRWSR